MTRRERFMPNDVPRHIRAYDNGGKTFDRYTVVYTGNYRGRNGCDYVGMSSNPFHPQGFCIHGWNETVIDYPKYSHLGRKIKFKDLPEDCQRLVIRDYTEIWRLEGEKNATLT
jgi:hypothetical protein